jgi:hypothetical protein
LNFFYLDEDPTKCAEFTLDKHVVKMITEHNQMLSTALWLTGKCGLYKPTHQNHPCAIWVRQSLSNYKKLCEFTLELCKEYTFRYGKIHAGEAVCRFHMENLPNIPDVGLTTIPTAMPDECKESDPISSYRKCYNTEKRSIATWKKREAPHWWKESV